MSSDKIFAGAMVSKMRYHSIPVINRVHKNEILRLACTGGPEVTYPHPSPAPTSRLRLRLGAPTALSTPAPISRAHTSAQGVGTQARVLELSILPVEAVLSTRLVSIPSRRTLVPALPAGVGEQTTHHAVLLDEPIRYLLPRDGVVAGHPVVREQPVNNVTDTMRADIDGPTEGRNGVVPEYAAEVASNREDESGA